MNVSNNKMMQKDNFHIYLKNQIKETNNKNFKLLSRKQQQQKGSFYFTLALFLSIISFSQHQFSNQNGYFVNANQSESKLYQGLKNKEIEQQVNVVGSDDIGTAATEDMLAFSQIISAGQNPMAIAEEMERQIKKPPPKPAGLSEDEAVAAFAEFMSGGGQIKDDPTKILAEKMKKEEQEKAAVELQSLQQNDATAAFAGLVDSQVIQQKAQLYEGSGTISPQEALQQSSLQKLTQQNKKQSDALAMVQKQSEEELQQVNKLVENTDTANQAIESGLIIVQPVPVLQKKQPVKQLKKTSSKLQKSKIQSALEKLESGYSVEDVRKFQLKQLETKKAGTKAQKMNKVPKQADLMISQQAEDDKVLQLKESTQTQKEEDAQVDAQAEEILNQIKSAAMGIKGIGGNGGIDDQQLKAALGGMNLLQIASDIHLDHDLNTDDNSQFDSNAKEALDFLSQRFPEDYPEDHVKPKKIEPSQQELAEKKNKEDLEYSKKVAQEASDYNEQLQKKNEEKQEQGKINDMLKEYNQDQKNLRRKYKKVNLAQISSSNKQKDINNSNFDENAQLALEFMSQQFPKDYPQDHIVAPKIEPSAQELAELEKKKMLDYSKKVAEQAAEYNQKLIKEQEEKEEQEKLKRMGIEGEPITLQLQNIKQKKDLSISLAQTGEKSSIDQLDIIAALKNGKQISEADIANLKDEDLDALNQNLNQLDLQEGTITAESTTEGQKVQTKSKQQSSETGQVQNSEEMKQYSESIVQAADIVTNESDIDKSKGDFDDTSFFDLKKQAIEASKAEKQQLIIQQSQKQIVKPIAKIPQRNIKVQKQINQKPIETQQNLPETNDPELEAKAAIVAQTEAANQAAIEEASSVQQKQVQKQVQPSSNIKVIQEQVLNQVGQDNELDEKTIKQQKIKFEADKQSALEQGFTLEQAERYAVEEQYQNKIQSAVIPDASQQISDNQLPQQPLLNAEKNSLAEMSDNKKQVQVKLNTPMTKPMTGPSGSPPTQKDDDKHAAQKVQEPVQDVVQPQDLSQQSANQQNELSIQEQINIAQNQQEQIKAALEKKKLENKNKGDSQQSMQQKQDLQKQAEDEALAEATAQYEAQEQLKNQQNQKQLVQQQSPVANQHQETNLQKPQQQVIEQIQEKQKTVQPQQIPQPVVNNQQPSVQIVQQKQEQQSQQNVQNSQIQAEQTLQQTQTVNNEIAAPKQNSQNQTQQISEQIVEQKQILPEKVIEKETIQEKSEINKHVPGQLKQKISKKQKLRAKKYEEDLNKARDEIKIAQNEMKTIDGEVANFHQKMGKSMHLLLEAFTEGFEAMGKAKQEEEEEEEEDSGDVELTQRRMEKFDKIHSGISNLEALTSQLKQSINDDAPVSENIQIDQALVNQKNEVKPLISQTQTLNQQKINQTNQVFPQVQNKQSSVQQSSSKVIQQNKGSLQNKKSSVQRNIIQAKINKITAQKTAVNNQKQLVKKDSIKPKAVQKQNPKIQQKIQPKIINQKITLQKSQNKKPIVQKQNIQKSKILSVQKPSIQKKQLISKIQRPIAHLPIKKAFMNGKINIKANKQGGKIINKNQLKLVQIDSEESLLNSLNAEEKLKSLLETREKLRHISQAIGTNRKARPETIEDLAKSLGLKMDENMKKEAQKGSNQLIAHSIAQKVLSQVQSKNSKDNSKLISSNKSVKLAQKALANKNVEDSELLQIGGQMKLGQSGDDNYNDEIYIFESQDDSASDDTQLEEKQLQEVVQIREADKKIRHQKKKNEDSNSQY